MSAVISPGVDGVGAFTVTYNGDATGFAVKSQSGWYNHTTGAFEAGPFDAAKHYAAVEADSDFPTAKVAVITPSMISPPFSVYWLKAKNPKPDLLDVWDFGAAGVPWVPPTPPTSGTIQLS